MRSNQTRLIDKARGRPDGRFVIGAALALAAVLGGCKVGPNYRAPATTAPAAFGELPTTPPAGGTPVVAQSDPDVRWWRRLRDPQLTSLVEQAVVANPSVAVAQARLTQARAVREQAQSLLYPEVHAGASIARFRAPAGALGLPAGLLSTEGNLYQIGFDATWVVDVFGGTRRQIESARAMEAATNASRRGVVLMVAAETARSYVELRGVQHELAVARSSLDKQKQILSLTEEKRANGLASELDVLRARTETEATASRIPRLDQAMHQYVHSIAVLVGTEPTALNDELLKPAPIPAIPDQILVGVPSDLLRRRPDVQVAERQLAAATAQVGVAVARLFPQVVLGGAAGMSDRTSGNPGRQSSGTYMTGPYVDWTVFDAGRRQAAVRASEAEVAVAKAEYEDTVRRSFADVENALVAVSREEERRDDLQRLTATTRQAVEIAQRDYQQGILDHLAVLDAERQADQADMLLADSDVTLTVNVVTLYKALGGGWEVAEPATQSASLKNENKEPSR